MPRLKPLTIWALIAGVLSGMFIYFVSRLPDTGTSSYAAIVFSDDGKELSEYYRERRFFIPYYRIPEHVKNAFVAIEDRRFYSHNGLDIKGILRALHRDLAARGIKEGGSTITQQLAKMILKANERSVSRKIKEMFVTIKLERNYTKEEILGMYLNLAYFGDNIYGIESAARTYFNKSAEKLSIGEAALLAALQKAPNRYSPVKNRKKAEWRRKIVLDEMLVSDLISPEEYYHAISEPLPAITYFRRKDAAPYFAEFTRQQLSRKYGDTVFTRGFRIQSTISAPMQVLAERAVKRGVREIEYRTGRGIQAALVAVDMHSGGIKAMVGGTDFGLSQFNRASMALRQPGSAFKPFVYAAALEQGISYKDRILDAPISIPDPERGGLWSPRNASWGYYGSVTLKTALSLSLNAATVRLAQDVGIERVREIATRCGIRADLRPHPSIALGSYEVTLLNLTASYIAFATGRRIEPAAYTAIKDMEGNVVENSHPGARKVFSDAVVRDMRILLRSVVESGTGGRALAVNRPVYGKTGTTNDYTDAWFVGFDDRMAVGVWVGRDDNTPIGHGESGSSTALAIWTDFMRHIKYAR